MNSFNSLKKYLCTLLILKLSDFDKTFKIVIDALGKGIGAVLLQKDKEDQERFICYALKVLNIYKQNYTTSEQEGLALLIDFKVWRPYLLSKKFLVVTDNKSLSYRKNNKNTNKRVTRWGIELSEFKFEVIHCAEKKI